MELFNWPIIPEAACLGLFLAPHYGKVSITMMNDETLAVALALWAFVVLCPTCNLRQPLSVIRHISLRDLILLTQILKSSVFTKI